MGNDSLIGRQLANFRIERAIGRGGMAEVYYGQDVKLERPVAVKVIDVRYRGDPGYAERFVREAKSVATWHHENIIQIYYADEEDELYYFVMEYIDGPDLGQLMSQRVTQGALISHPDILRIGRAVAKALDYAHQQGLIHRDVKPANVMVAPDERIVLTDFGLAMEIEQGSIGEVFGSSHYIAPEQAHRSADAVPQSDLYSLGVILYEMLTGKVPFDDPSPTAVALQHLTLTPPRPRVLNPNLSPEIEAVLLKALSKKPAERYQTGAALMDALEEAMQTVPAGYATQPEPPPGSTAGRADVEPAQPPAAEEAGPEDLIGQQLDEYRLEALLGRGGMARVYRGLDVRLKRWVAIKVIDTPFRTEADYVARFEREAQAIAQLEHGHIVRLYRYGEARNLLYMAMQYVEGADLEAVLSTYRQEDSFIEPEEAGRIVREICQALDYAHNKGVIHRDIKPSNIMLDKEGCVILTDFGLALLTEVGTRGEIFGSPHYIAPEQAISSAGAVSQSDLYAIGIILYEIFTGQVPFEAEKPLDVAMMHIDQAPRSPREVRPDLSPELEAVILKALAKEPADRYPTGAALADALDEALHLVPARPATASQLSIPQRVANSLAEYPLPPVPAAVSTPGPKGGVADSQPAPAAPSDSEPAADKPGAGPAPPAPEPAAETEQPETPEYSLPSIPPAVATPGSQPAPAAEAEVTDSPPEAPAGTAPATPPPSAAAPEPVPPSPAAAPDPVSPAGGASASLDKRLLAYVAGLGAIITIGIVLVMLLLAVILGLLLWNRFSAQQTAGQVVPAAQVTPETEVGGPESGTAATATRLPAPAAVITPTNTSTVTPVPPPPTPTKSALGPISPVETPAPPATPSPGPTSTRSSPTSEPSTPAPSPTLESTAAGPTGYKLLLAKQGEDSLFVVNQGPADFPPALLRLGDEAGAIAATEWSVDQLEPEACVTAWKKEGNPNPPDVACLEVGERLTRSGSELFWKDDFNVYYDGALVGSCEKIETECSFTISIE